MSTAVVGLAEIGDKTQILSLMLAARFQRPVPIIFGILFATLANHAAAGVVGTFSGSLLSGSWGRGDWHHSCRFGASLRAVA
jgi:putative Ca2+/H+ antiporter (TMEM165/GDT1 family)